MQSFAYQMAWPLVVMLLPIARVSEADEHFERRIRPVLVESCLPCHGGKETEANLKLNSREGLLAGGDRGPAIVPGKPDESVLLRALTGTDDDLVMPPGKRLPKEAVEHFRQWIEAGAPWPDGKPLADDSDARRRSHWSFQPLLRPVVPDLSGEEEMDNAIDRFIAAKLTEHNLTPTEEAEKQILLRRVTFDLTGLPPTIEEIERFYSDESPDHWERLVDRLLATSAYGERWGRHWLDVVRYADTAGNAPDFPVPQARLYRDYVIEAFAKDKPFDQFVREQIAGDLLEATSDEQRREQIIATGYLAIGRRYFGTASRTDHLEMEDLIHTAGLSLLGLSIGCARCHDHKFDPVSQRDYYALYGILSSTRYALPGMEGNAKQENFVDLGDGSNAYAVAEGTAANAKVHIGGDPGSTGDEVPRGFVSILGGQQLSPDVSGSGRRELAQWLTDSQRNPLLARVIVNRLWQHHFGAGLVRTPDDFGLRGEPPTHPKLLDFLASELIENGWSIKAIQRQMLLSSAYRRSARLDEQGQMVDPTNRWLWRQSRRRLDAEATRDALLAVAHALDRSRGGEHPFPPKEEWRFSQHAPFEAVYASNRRSVYLMQQRLKKHPMLALFDGADPNASTAQRLPTTTPLQSLFYMNDPFVHELANQFAERIIREAGSDSQRLNVAFRALYGRSPRTGEQEAARNHLRQVRQKVRASGITLDAEETRLSWNSLARVLLSSNEFLYVD